MILVKCFIVILFFYMSQAKSILPPKVGGVKPRYTANLPLRVPIGSPPECTAAATPQGRSGLPEFRWPGGVLPVMFHDSIGNENQALIQNVLFKLGKLVPCIEVRIHSSVKGLAAYVLVRGDIDDGCWASMGIRNQNHTIHFAATCFIEGTIFHEFMHILGFAHEHTRPDRDSYIKILNESIQTSRLNQFAIQAGSETFDIPYDFTSVMHYPLNAFGLLQVRPPFFITLKQTMRIVRQEDLKYSSVVGQRRGPSAYDIQKLKAMYKDTKGVVDPKCVDHKSTHTNYAGKPTNNYIIDLAEMDIELNRK